MRKFYSLIFTTLMMLASASLSAQSEATSPRMSFNIVKEVKPPLWEIVEEPHFVDEDGNSVIDADEVCKIVMKLKNIGLGDGRNLTANISATGSTTGITYSSRKIQDIATGSTATIEFPLTTDMSTVDGSASFTVFVEEPLGFNSDQYMLKVQTRAFQAPMVEVKDYVATCDNGGKLEKMKPFQLQVLIQNTQYGLAEDIAVTLMYPSNVYNLGGLDKLTIPKLEAGEAKTLTYSLLVNNQYEGSTLPLQIKVKEKFGKYAHDKSITLELNQKLVNRSIDVAARVEPKTTIVDAQLRSDVDRDIPQTENRNSHRYAIVIGNQDCTYCGYLEEAVNTDEFKAWQEAHPDYVYCYVQGVNSKDVAPNADANVFKQYCQRTLGIEESNIVLLNNATAAKMNQEIDFITRLAERDAQAEIVFYFSGHGFPDENTKEPYLIPVDVNASSLRDALSLYELYGKLTATGANRVTVFLDACFSGGGRNAGLIASRGIRVTPKKDALTGNIVVFSATSADQTALPYSEKQHGMFTYYLLKKFKDSRGECSYSELYDYLNRNVGNSSLRVNRKDQTPEVNTSPQVQDSWGGWKFN